MISKKASISLALIALVAIVFIIGVISMLLGNSEITGAAVGDDMGRCIRAQGQVEVFQTADFVP